MRAARTGAVRPIQRPAAGEPPPTFDRLQQAFDEQFGVIDRIDRQPDGSIEVVDYKTGRTKSQTQVHEDEQLSTYALALARGAVVDEATGEPLPPASKLTLYFTESDTALSTTRTPGDLDAHATKLARLAASMRAGDFAAMPSYRGCGWCDFARVCPDRFQSPAG